MNSSSIVVIGISAGGMEPLFRLVESIPDDCLATFFVVQHIPSHAESNLHRILASHTSLEVSAADNKLVFEPGHIYTACSDRHLLVQEGHMMVTKGPRENYFRPSIDALFRSAAYAYRGRVIGVIMSGALNDGTSGMWAIKNFGGISIIQSRAEAMFDSMPNGVADYVELDYELPSREIGPMIYKLIQRPEAESFKKSKAVVNEEFTSFEINVAGGKNALERGVLKFGGFSPLTCPECHGALTEYTEGKLKRFRCHTGHAHTAESILAGIENNIEKNMWEVMRGMEEKQLLLNHLSDNFAGKGETDRAEVLAGLAEQSAENSKAIKAMISSKDGPANLHMQ